MHPRLVVLVLLAALAVAPATAVAQDPFGPLPQAPQEQPPPPQPTDPRDDGLSRQQQLLIGLAGFVLLFGIGWAIVRDAKHAAPAERDVPSSSTADPPPKGSRRPPAQRTRTNREKARAARQSRKRNR